MPEPVTPLSADHAFVLQLQKSRGGAKARRCGRIEHLTTGQATSFTTPAELWDFVDEVLTELARHEHDMRENEDREAPAEGGAGPSMSTGTA